MAKSWQILIKETSPSHLLQVFFLNSDRRNLMALEFFQNSEFHCYLLLKQTKIHRRWCSLSLMNVLKFSVWNFVSGADGSGILHEFQLDFFSENQLASTNGLIMVSLRLVHVVLYVILGWYHKILGWKSIIIYFFNWQTEKNHVLDK